jgi:hypothetical protein
MIRSFACFAFAAAITCFPACTEFSSLCGKSIDCEGGNDKDKAACADKAEAAEDEASDYGCSTQFGALVTCTEDHATCTMGKFSVSSGCDQTEKDLETCISANSARKH